MEFCIENIAAHSEGKFVNQIQILKAAIIQEQSKHGQEEQAK